MRLVILESPFSGNVERNVLYARSAMLDCLHKGDAPMASHLLYTQVLDDNRPDSRSLGIDAGHAWLSAVQACVVYGDLGLSKGMALGIQRAVAAQVPLEYRKLYSQSRTLPRKFSEYRHNFCEQYDTGVSSLAEWLEVCEEDPLLLEYYINIYHGGIK